MRARRRLLPFLFASTLGAAGCGDEAPLPPPPDLALRDLSVTVPPDLTAVTDGNPMEDLTPPQDLVPEGDMALPPCANTPNSCGMPGMCVDCANNPVGLVCVMVNGAPVCGCNAAADCPLGTACDPKKHVCDVNCAGPPDDGGATVLACNGGCCDGGKCVAGNANNACGAGGGKCATCGGGTPTCNNAACTATCAPGGMGGAACGNGFCCGPNNTCVAVGNVACGLAGAACVDCSKSPDGPLCNAMSGKCGCATSGDCPMGQACRTGACTATCDANAACNGGCCNIAQGMMTGTCSVGNLFDQCATAAVCTTCVGNMKGGACVVVNNMVTCGCNSAIDCPAGQACNAVTKTCSTACDANTACRGGCCNIPMGMNVGTCVAGTGQANCGNNGGVCVSCLAQFMGMMAGNQCLATMGGGQCGCNVNGDCPANSTGCNVNTKVCNFACSAMAPCLTGCCNIPMGMIQGTCAAGTGNGACGATGVCSDCAANNAGHICVAASRKCGCNVAADCPMGVACNTTTHVCENVCGDVAHTVCNGGCCSAAKCLAGNANNACGAMGACADCTANNKGHVCIAGACGCLAAGDCPAGTACNTKTNACEVTCGDANHTICSGGCCNIAQGMMTGACVAGTSNVACGTDGKTCAACGKGTPTCTMGMCTADCGNVGNGTCDGGFCCNAMKKCVAGNAQMSCGFSGACSDCTNQNNGHKCVSAAMNGPWFCGCDVAVDCPAANVNANTGGLACDTQGHNCTTSCGIQGITTVCNGGCCQFANGAGVCRAGAAPATCGNSGGLCSNCTLNCANVATCANGACGCCLGPNSVCQMNAQCCTNTCTNARCACIAAGSPCIGGNATLCCAGAFGQAQTCGGPNITCCLAAGQFCNANNQCCNGTCMGNARCN